MFHHGVTESRRQPVKNFSVTLCLRGEALLHEAAGIFPGRSAYR
jgi:hypothetical protein